MQVRLFGREPAAVLYAVNAVIAFVVTLPSVGLSEEAAGWLMTVASGVIALIVAVLTRPFVVSALTGALQTVLAGLASFGLPITPQMTATFIVLVSAVLALALRANVSPAPAVSDSHPGSHTGVQL
jgi:hypothetical protein